MIIARCCRSLFASHRSAGALALATLLALGCADAARTLGPKDGLTDAAARISCQIGTGGAAQCTSAHVTAAAALPVPGVTLIARDSVRVVVSAGSAPFDPITGVLTMHVSVVNLADHAIGTRDGSAVTGVRVFYARLPRVVGGTGTVQVAGATGVGAFVQPFGSVQPFYLDDEIIPAKGTSRGTTWKWVITGQPAWEFEVGIAADIPGSGSPSLIGRTVAAGGTHTCGLAITGEAYCWGLNSFGELGDGTTRTSTTPVAVVGGLRFVSIAVGDSHSCALTSDGQTYCWGGNYEGQLGNGKNLPGSVPPTLQPEAVPQDGVRYRSISAGGTVTCAISTTASAYCWGTGTLLGAGTSTINVQPVAVTGGHLFTEIDVYNGHTCGLTAEGVVYCWGRNDSGQLGNGTISFFGVYTLSPVAVQSDVRFARLANGYGEGHTCALDASGNAYCWGRMISRDDQQVVPVPVVVPGGLSFSRITVGFGHDCAISLPYGHPYCWGSNESAQLGTGRIGQLTSVSQPTAVSGGMLFESLSAGGSHTCAITSSGHAITSSGHAITSSGQMECWGGGTEGQLGNGSIGVRRTPVRAALLPNLGALSVGANSACGLADDGRLYCWGSNEVGQLGAGSSADYSLSPLAVANAHRFTQVAVGLDGACAIDFTGAVSCWGTASPDVGTIGNYVKLVEVPPGVTFSQLSVGWFVACGLTPAGKAYCWGNNQNGMLGSGSLARSSVAVPVAGGLTFTSISTSRTHSCALDVSGQAYCWGWNSSGQLGNGRSGVNEFSDVPMPVASALRFTRISAGDSHTCALDAAGGGYCWGSGTSGEIGNRSSSDQLTPVPVEGGPYLSIVASSQASCALDISGRAFCWGTRDALGAGDAQSSNSPIPVAGTLSFASLSASGFGQSICGLSGGQAYCWGNDFFGQLGSGNHGFADRPSPVSGGITFQQSSALIVCATSNCAPSTAGTVAAAKTRR
ncbi:MAG: hypothetical protein ABJD07_05455 [Gemmatimonadaceae bacterium]